MTTKAPFTVYPAIDLRGGEVVRLSRGDPNRQTTYSLDPFAVVLEWLNLGIKWVHVINLDGAFGEQTSATFKKISEIAKLVHTYGASIQYGGGLRSIDAISAALDIGIERVILGTMAIEDPDAIRRAIELFGDSRVAVSLDAEEGRIRTRGWAVETPVQASTLGQELFAQGVRWAIHTDISRDGMGSGANIDAATELKRATGLNIIAAGGVKYTTDLLSAREAGLSGIIVGRAIFEGSVTIHDCIRITDSSIR